MGSKKYRGWEKGLRADEQRAVDPETPVHKSRKDRHRWCRGKIGVEHRLVYRISKNELYWHCRHPGDPRYGECGWQQQRRWIRAESRWEPIPDDWRYHCGHEKGCSECGKILVSSWKLPKTECPDWSPRS